MGGEGSMQAMKTILQNNKNLLRKKRMFDEKPKIKHSNTQLKFKEISRAELQQVKLEIRKKAKKEQKRFRVMFSILALLVVVMFYFLLKDFSIDFDLFFKQI